MLKQERTIGVRELKSRTSEVLRELQRTGAEVIITVHGRPVARLGPMGEAGPEGPSDGMGGLRGTWAALPQAEWEDFEAVGKAWEPDDSDVD